MRVKERERESSSRREGGREAGRKHPVGSLLPDSLKGALFQQERSEAKQWSCPGPPL